MTFAKYLILTLLFNLIAGLLCAQAPEVTFNPKGDLVITPAASSGAKDYDFLEGKWKVANRKLKTLLKGSTGWTEFESTLQMKKILTGKGNREQYLARIGDQPYEAIAIRLFDDKTRLWTDFWIDSKTCVMDSHPTSGSFENAVGRFFAKDTYDGKDITVVYQWDKTDPDHPVWSQAFSADSGKTWEWNWHMTLTRVKE